MFSPEQAGPDTRRVALHTGIAAVAAVVVFLGLRLAGQDFVVDARGDNQPVPVGAVVVSTVLAGIGAYLLARLALRTARPRRTFVGAALLGLALSAFPPALSATAVSTAGWLMVLHVVVAAVLVPPLARALPATTADRSLT